MDEHNAGSASPLPRAFLLLLVTVTGATILALEILGTRVIGTHYGSSLYVWAALLIVTLLCLAVGYAVGGRIADRVPKAWMLHLLVMLAGGSVLLVAPLTAVLVPLGDALGLAWGAIASAGIIFFLPLTILAMASPYVIRLRARAVEGVGSTSGAVYAVSTVGSVAGVLAVSLWMIPTLGTRLSLLVCSGALIGIGAIGLLVTWRAKAAPALLLAALPALVPAGDRPVAGELFHTESAYGDIRVIQQAAPGSHGHRMLMMNGIMQTGMRTDIDLVARGSILGSDSYYLELLPYYHADLGEGRRGVLIGLAGGMFPRVMEFYDIDWTAVEIDVNVAELAKAYFGYRGDIFYPDGSKHLVDVRRFPRRELPLAHLHADHIDEHRPAGPYRGRAVIQDGRQYLTAHPEKIDFIVVDAYNSDTIPFHLITREFFELIRDRLTDDGILAINYIGPPGDDFVTASLFRTLGAVFGRGRVEAYRSTVDTEAVQVITVLAFRRKMELLPLWREDPTAGADPVIRELITRRLDTAGDGGAVITDDLNPIDLARARTAIDWRRVTGQHLK